MKLQICQYPKNVKCLFSESKMSSPCLSAQKAFLSDDKQANMQRKIVAWFEDLEIEHFYGVTSVLILELVRKWRNKWK